MHSAFVVKSDRDLEVILIYLKLSLAPYKPSISSSRHTAIHIKQSLFEPILQLYAHHTTKFLPRDNLAFQVCEQIMNDLV